MARYRVTIAEEVYHTYEIEAEFDEEPNVYKWNASALELRDLAWGTPRSEAINEEDSEFIDFLTIEEVG